MRPLGNILLRPRACPVKIAGNHGSQESGAQGVTPTNGDLAVNFLARPVPVTKWLGIRRPARSKNPPLAGCLDLTRLKRSVDSRAKPPLVGCVNQEVEQAGLFPTTVLWQARPRACPDQHGDLCRSDMVPAKLCNETASKRYFHTSLAQARSDIHIVGGVANPANSIVGQERAIPPHMRPVNYRETPTQARCSGLACMLSSPTSLWYQTL